MPTSFKGNDITVESVLDKNFGFPAEMRAEMEDNLEFAQFVVDAYIDAANRKDGLAAGKSVWADMYSTDANGPDIGSNEDTDEDGSNEDTDEDGSNEDTDEDGSNEDTDEDGSNEDTDEDGSNESSNTGKDDTSVNLVELLAKIAQTDADIERFADSANVVEALAAQRAVLVAQEKEIRAASEQAAGRVLTAEYTLDIETGAFEFRGNFSEQSGRRLDNFVVQFVRADNPNPTLGYESAAGTDESGIKMVLTPNWTAVAAGATSAPSRATKARATTGDTEEKRAAKEKAAAERAKKQEDNRREKARLEHIASGCNLFGCAITLADGTKAEMSLADMVEQYATDEIRGKAHWSKGKGNRINPRYGFPQMVIAVMESNGLTVQANN